MFIQARPTPFIFPRPVHALPRLSSPSLSCCRLGPTHQRPSASLFGQHRAARARRGWAGVDRGAVCQSGPGLSPPSKHRSGHFARECTAPKKNATQSHVTHLPRGPLKVTIAKTGHVNYIVKEGIPEGEQVIAVTFSLNRYSIVVLFDSSATHDFISKACIQKSQLVIQHMSVPYLIKTPGGKICTNQLVKNTPLNLGGKEYKTCLIILEGQGIDIILGMG
jgi:hypothetical protein